MKSHKTIRDYCQNYGWACGADLKNMYFSVHLAKETQKFFGIRTSLGDFFYTKLPFGFSWSGFIAHICFDEVIKEALSRGIPCTHFADDIKVFGHTRFECQANWDALWGLICDAGWRLNDKKFQPPATTINALGVTYNLRDKTSSLDSKKLDQIKGLVGVYSEYPCLISTRQIASFIGQFCFLSFAYPGSLAMLNPLLAFTRKQEWDRKFLFSSVRPYIVHVIKFFETLRPARLQSMTSVRIANSLLTRSSQGGDDIERFFTDATEEQLGILIPDYLGLKGSFSFRLAQTTPIYRAEALAVKWLLSAPWLPGTFLVLIDNQALYYALLKGRSNDPAANFVCYMV